MSRTCGSTAGLWKTDPAHLLGDDVAGTLAITGVGIAGVFGFAGFYSKDAIIEAALCERQPRSGGVAWFLGRLRGAAHQLLFLAARSSSPSSVKPRWAGSEHIQHAMHDAHGHGHHDASQPRYSRRDAARPVAVPGCRAMSSSITLILTMRRRTRARAPSRYAGSARGFDEVPHGTAGYRAARKPDHRC